MKFFLKSLNKKFAVRTFIKLTLFIVTVSLSFTTFFILQQRESLTDNLIKQGELLAKLLAYNSRLGVFTENKDLLRNSVEGFLQYQEVLSVSIFNPEGKLLIKQERPGTEKQGIPETFTFRMPVISGSQYSTDEALFFDDNLFSKKDRIIGFVEVILDKSILNNQLEVLLRKGILMGAIFLMVGAVMAYLMVQRITRPIEKLSNASVEVGKGNVDVRLEITSKDEIGQLTASFNKMVSELKEYRDNIQDIVNKRTAELNKANEQLRREIMERTQTEEKLRNYQSELRSLASELSLIEERERRRIAADLHDRIGQSLAISKLKLGELRKMTSSNEGIDALNKTYELISQTIQDARSLVFELSPPILYELGFEAAVEWLTEQIQEQHGILTKFEDDKKPKPLDDHIRVLLFQAVRELLINVAKHSQARNVNVSIQNDGYNIQIKVEDDGIGFDNLRVYSTTGRISGFGLFNIRERLDFCGGYVKIVSEPSSGTQVTLVAPMKQSNENSNKEVS